VDNKDPRKLDVAPVAVVAAATLASRVLGLVRDSLTAAVFGAGGLLSAFFTAFQLPNLFRRLLGEGALTAAFVPVLNEELERRRREGAFRLVNEVASWLLVVSAAVTGAAMVFFSQPAWIEAAARAFGGDDAVVARWLASGGMTVALFPYLVFVCLAAVFSSALQTLGRFLEPAVSPAWLNVAMIAALVIGWKCWPDGGGALADIADIAGAGGMRMRLLCAGVLIGGAGQMVLPAWALARRGWRPRFALALSGPVRAIFRLMAPTVLGSAVYLVNMTVARFIALSLNDGAVALLNFAQRLMELPIGVFAVAVSTVVFPLISRRAAQGDMEGMAEGYRRGMRLVLLVNVPAAAGLAVLAVPLIGVLFQRGAFAAGDTLAMAPVLAVCAAGLPFFSFVNLMLRAFYARRDTRTPVLAAGLSFVVNLGLSLALMRRFGTAGLAAAGSVAIAAQAVFLQIRLTAAEGRLAFRFVRRDLGKIIAASVAMGAAVRGGWLAWEACAGTGSKWADAAGLGLMIAAGAAVYGALAWLLRVEGLGELAGVLRRRFGKGGNRAGENGGGKG
jgi:putative peptidoglycan lipid II flippase